MVRSIRSRIGGASVTLVALSALIATSAPASAAPDARAIASWSMVPQSRDANGDGVIDGDGGVPRSGALSRQPSPQFIGAGNRIAQPNERLIGGSLSWYLDDRGFAVRLDACQSRGDEARWRILRGGATVRLTSWRPITPRRCSRTVTLPEGDYVAVLEVKAGRRTVGDRLPMTVDNLVVVSLGDSYASGEGNPRNVGAWLRQGGALSPYWDDDACRRSARGAPALAALALEEASAFTSVTLVHVACSGATVDAGILGPQAAAGQGTSQVQQAAAILRGRPADLVLLSIGGNDVGFGSILETCALASDCPVARPRGGALAGSPTVNAGVQARTGGLVAQFARIADCLGDEGCGFELTPTARVLPTLYPDITRAANGSPCAYLTIPDQDFAWARATILDPAPPPTYPYPLGSGATAVLPVSSGSLNQQILATAQLPAWLPVAGTWTASGSTPEGHGVCAGEQSWVFGFTGLSGLPTASFHPDPTGQRVMANAITAAASGVVALGG